MQRISAVAFFCEDIRREIGGTDTIVGIWPDNVAVPEFPFSFPKLALYVRVNLDPHYDPGQMQFFLRHPDGEEHDVSEIDSEVVDKARNEALSEGKVLCGLIFRAIRVGYRLPMAGVYYGILRHSGGEEICGLLNLPATT